LRRKKEIVFRKREVLTGGSANGEDQAMGRGILGEGQGVVNLILAPFIYFLALLQ